MADPSLTQEKRCLHQNNFQEKFGQDVSDLLSPGNPDGTSLINFCKGRIKKLHLYDVEFWDLISLGVEQGLIYTETREIKFSLGWMYTSIHRITQNLVRKKVAQKNLFVVLVANTPMVSDDQISKLEFEDLRNLLIQAREHLTVDEQEIIGLHFDCGKSYEEMRDYYGHKDYTLGAIRQKVCRAKKRLIEEFRLLSTDQVFVQAVKKLPKHAAIKTAIEPKIYSI
jgi:DNA-directed RNA polymerase specialized sigma24 family protein